MKYDIILENWNKFLLENQVIEEKKKKDDRCTRIAKDRYKTWPSAYACVPEHSSKALTKAGWKSVEQLSLNEEILTFNIDKDILEFKPIQKIHRYKEADTNVVKSGNTGFVFEATQNHKWVVKLPQIISERQSKYIRNHNDYSLIETNEILNNKHNKLLVVSAPYLEGNKTLKNKIYKYGDNWISYLLEATQEQRQAWLFSAIIYDGNQKKAERLTENKNNSDIEWQYDGNHGKQSFGFKQKDITHRDAFLLSAFLNEGLVTWKKVKNKEIYSCNYTSNKRYKNTSNFKLVSQNITDVWCPQTENSTWVMMQETNGQGIITITGNSGALVRCRKGEIWKNISENATDEEIHFELLLEEVQIINEKCWDGYTQKGMKTMFGKRYPNCVKKTNEEIEIIDEYLNENFYLAKDTGKTQPLSLPILNAILSKIPNSPSANSLKQIEASGAEGIVFSLDDFRVIKIFFALENALKSAPLLNKKLPFTANIYSAGRVEVDLPLIYYRKNSSYSSEDVTPTKNIYYLVMQRVVPDEETYNSIEMAYDRYVRISKIQYSELIEYMNLNQENLTNRIKTIISNFLTDNKDITNFTKDQDSIEFLNSLDKKKKNVIINQYYPAWAKTKTKEFVLLDNNNKPLILKNFLLNEIEYFNSVDYDVSVVKQFLLQKKEFSSKSRNGKTVLLNFQEVENLIKQIVVESKIPWNDIHKGQFGRNKKGSLIALDLGIKQEGQNNKFLFDKNVSKLSLASAQIKLVSESIKKKIINFWDFDKTLFDTDDKTEGIRKWENIYNQKYPHIGWFSKKESLDPNLNFKPIKNNIDKYYELSNNSINYILSNRQKFLKKEISKILELNNIFVDGYLLHNGKNKTQRIQDYLEENPDCDEINIFDDKISILLVHEQKFKQLYNTWRPELKINLYDTSSGKPVLFMDEQEAQINEKWSEKYKSSIDCKNPKGFSQKAHCQGKKKNEDIDLEEVEIIEEAKKDYKPNFSKEKEQGLHGWFARNKGKGWINCRTGGPCGRDSADSGGKYPACRPTKAQCKSAGKGPLSKKKSSSAISWTKKKKKE